MVSSEPVCIPPLRRNRIAEIALWPVEGQGMLRRLSIQTRTPGELRQLASERRELAASKDGSIKALLLNEARLLDFHAELRAWIERTEASHANHRLGDPDPRAAQPVPQDLAPFLTKLSSRMALPASDQHALLAAALPPRHLARDEFIVDEGQRPSSLLFLCSGTARAARTLEDGSQQIVAVFLAGDALNPGELVLGPSRTSICALAPAIVLEIQHPDLLFLMESRPAIMRALWRETALQAAIQREWLIWLGQRPAEARLAHLLCEVSYRLQLGGGNCDAFEFPLTQRELADTRGLSSVHVNRVLQLLRSRKLIDLNRSRLAIRDKPGLYAIAEFDPGYLDVSGPEEHEP
jgi:CRP-like cAMP-binding protein